LPGRQPRWDTLHALLLTRLRAADEIEWSRAVDDSSHLQANDFRRLLVRYERRAEMHEAMLALVCFRRLRNVIPQ
jgi:hypothetical protein